MNIGRFFMFIYLALVTIADHLRSISATIENVKIKELIRFDRGIENFKVVLFWNEDKDSISRQISEGISSAEIGLYTNSSQVSHFIQTTGMDTLIIIKLQDEGSSQLKSVNKFDFPKMLIDAEKKLRTFIILIWPTVLHDAKQFYNTSQFFNNLDTDTLTIDTNFLILFRVRLNPTEEILNELWEFYKIKFALIKNCIARTPFPIDFDIWEVKNLGRRSNFHGIPIAAISIFEEEYESHYEDTKFVDTSASVLEFESGFSVSLYRDLKFTLKFSEIALGGNWLQTNADATKLDGPTGEALTSGLADIGIQQEKIQKELASLVTFLHPTYPLTVIAFVRDTTIDTLGSIYVLPFRLIVWLSIILTASGIWATLRILSWFRRKLDLMSNTEKMLDGESFFFIISGCFAQKGFHLFPTGISMRTVFLTSYFAGTVLFSAYTAALVSKFSVRREGVNSFEDLLQHKYAFIVNRNSFSMTNYAKEFQAYHGRRMDIVAPEAITETILTTQTAFLYYVDSVKEIFSSYSQSVGTRQEDFLCDVISSFPIRKAFPSAMVLRKGSPYKEIFNQKIVKIKEYGLNDRYKREYERKTQPRCLPKSQSCHNTLGLWDTLTSFNLLLFGFVLATFQLYVERYLFRRRSPLMP